MSLSGSTSTRGAGYTENYFSLDDILATQERVPCKFELPLYNLGFLEAGSDSEHIQPETKMELPMWMARALCSKRRHIVSIELPKQYKAGYREVFSADAGVVDLHKMGPYFYVFGTHLLCFEHPESADMAKSLVQIFQARFRGIMDSSQNAYRVDTSRLTSKLDEMERDIFQCGQLGLNDFQRWETRQAEKLSTSDLVVNHKKRKRGAMEDE